MRFNSYILAAVPLAHYCTVQCTVQEGIYGAGSASSMSPCLQCPKYLSVKYLAYTWCHLMYLALLYLVPRQTVKSTVIATMPNVTVPCTVHVQYPRRVQL